MILDIIAIVVLIGCLIGLAVIIFRKFPTLAAVDPTATAGQIATKKDSLVEQRLRRKLVSVSTKLGGWSTPLRQRSGRLWEQVHKRLVDLEHEYKIRALPVFLSRRQRRKIDVEIADILAQAQALIGDKEYHAAEDKTMQAIRLEPRSVPAFELLGQIYTVTKEYGHAKEVYSYLLKLTGDTDAIYEHLGEVDQAEGNLEAARDDLKKAVVLNHTVAGYHLQLAQVYAELGDLTKAFNSIQEAARLEANNPKILDQLVEISILAGKRQFAADALSRIEAVNPGNSKIADWRKRIDEMSNKPLASTSTNELKDSQTDQDTNTPL